MPIYVCEFEIKNIPPGQYTLEIWHEILGTQTQEITVSESGIGPLIISYKR